MNNYFLIKNKFLIKGIKKLSEYGFQVLKINEDEAHYVYTDNKNIVYEVIYRAIVRSPKGDIFSTNTTVKLEELC